MEHRNSRIGDNATSFDVELGRVGSTFSVHNDAGLLSCGGARAATRRTNISAIIRVQDTMNCCVEGHLRVNMSLVYSILA